jgi:hypothetical protein
LIVDLELGREGVLDVEQWAEIRRMRFVEGLAIREIARRTGRDRKTVQRAIRSSEPPRYQRTASGSKLDPFGEEIHRLLRADPRLPGTRVRELIAELGCEASKTLVDNYLREVRPLYLPRRAYQRTQYRSGEIVQFDLFEPRKPVAVGYGQSRRRWVVVVALCFSRAMAGALIFSKEAVDVLWGLARCLGRLGGLPELLVTDREGCLHAGGGKPTEEFAAFCGRLEVGWIILEQGDAQATDRSSARTGSCAPTSCPGDGSRTSWTSSPSWIAGARRPTVRRTARCAAGRSIALLRSRSGCGRCLSGCLIPSAAGCCACPPTHT